MADRLFILYDSRACGAQGTEEASVLVACEDNKEARSYCGDYGAMACYSYAHGDSGTLIDEQWEWDWWPNERRQHHKKRPKKYAKRSH